LAIIVSDRRLVICRLGAFRLGTRRRYGSCPGHVEFGDRTRTRDLVALAPVTRFVDHLRIVGHRADWCNYCRAASTDASCVITVCMV